MTPGTLLLLSFVTTPDPDALPAALEAPAAPGEGAPPPAEGDPDFARRAAQASEVRSGRIGNLELSERLGVGAMGAVYRATHTTLRTSFAVKILHPQYSSDEQAIERFRLEAVACSRLRHENIVFVTDFGFEEGLGLYIAMEYLKGRSLGAILRWGGALSLGRVARIAEQICAAMAAAHRLDIIHRDLKPDNLVVLDDVARRDFVKVLDFGIAKVRSETRDLTADSAVGTPGYMAPEQLMAKDDVGPQTDIYALGCILYAMLTGSPPFSTGSDFEILMQHVSAAPAPIHTHLPDLEGTKMAALVMQMLEKEYTARPASMDAVRELLHEAVLELMEAGVAGAVYELDPFEDPLVRTGEFATVPLSVHPIRMTQVIERIRDAAPMSPSAALLAALPSVGALQGEVLCLALWGIIQQDIIDAKLGSPEFEQSSDQLLLLLQATLESHEGSRLSQTQTRIFRSLANLLDLLPRDRQRLIARALRPLAAHDLFPSQLLAGENTGSWTVLRSMLTTEITLPKLGWRRPEDPAQAAERARREAELKGMSLLEKLKQDVSVRNLRSVLSHNITAAGSNAIEALDEELGELDEEAEP